MVRIYFLLFRIKVKWKGLRKFRKPFCRCSRLMTFGSTFLIWLFYLYFLVNDFPFLFRYAKGISDRSFSIYFLVDNFSLQNFLLFLQRVLGESISSNEASVPLAITEIGSLPRLCNRVGNRLLCLFCFPFFCCLLAASGRPDRLSIAHIVLHIRFIFYLYPRRKGRTWITEKGHKKAADSCSRITDLNRI